MRKFPDGTIMFPAKGKPPKPLEGYYAFSPFVHKPLLQPCKYRGFKRVKRDCDCPDRIKLDCQIKGGITAGDCLGCTDCQAASFMSKALTYAGALIYGEAVSDKIYTKRLDSCGMCHYNQNGTCGQCGCNLHQYCRYPGL